MKLISLANRTDMIFHRVDAIVQDHGTYISVETPNNPGYYWGNYLIFNRPPRKEDFLIWRDLFKKRFGHNPLIKHEVYTWENQSEAEPLVEDFLLAGFKINNGLLMVCESTKKPTKWNSELIVRPLETNSDWNQALENQVLTHSGEFEPSKYREYRKKKNDRYRKMIADGQGVWFGGFSGNNLLGDMGLFFEKELGRFQLVSTHPDHRRKGVCGTILYTLCKFGFEKLNLKSLVIAADDEYFAKKIYTSVGFQDRERYQDLELRPLS